MHQKAAQRRHTKTPLGDTPRLTNEVGETARGHHQKQEKHQEERHNHPSCNPAKGHNTHAKPCKEKERKEKPKKSGRKDRGKHTPTQPPTTPRAQRALSKL